MTWKSDKSVQNTKSAERKTSLLWNHRTRGWEAKLSNHSANKEHSLKILTDEP